MVAGFRFLSFALFATAAFAAAIEIRDDSKVPSAQPSYNCGRNYNNCLEITGGNTTRCDAKLDSCKTCATREVHCRNVARKNESSVYTEEQKCTQKAQICYHNAEDEGSLLVDYYSCRHADKTCRTAYLANQSFCTAQKNKCDACIDQEENCRTFPQDNGPFCSAQVEKCYHKAIYM